MGRAKQYLFQIFKEKDDAEGQEKEAADEEKKCFERDMKST